jgi:hypothetical protein
MIKRIIIISILVIYTLLIFLPPVVHGYIYPNNGDDSGFHVEYFERLANGTDNSLQYLGQKIIGYPLNFISSLTNVEVITLFTWFNFIVLWLIGISYFIVLTKLINYKVGLVSIPIVMFITPSTLNLFDNGSIYDLITVGVMFPFFMYCLVKLYVSRKWIWSLPVVLFVGLLLIVHTMGVFGGKGAGNIIPNISDFFLIYVGYSMIILVIVICFHFLYNSKWMMTKELKGLLVASFVVIIALTILIFSGLIGWSMRLSTELAIILPLFISAVVGLLFLRNNKITVLVISLFAVVLAIPNIISYSGYNNAIKPLDKEAIAYVNSLDGKYYSCSPQVAPWIYGHYLNKTYKEGALPYIVRNEPMSPRTNPDAKDYWWDNGAMGYPRTYQKLAYYENEEIKKFDDNELEIYVVFKGVDNAE